MRIVLWALVLAVAVACGDNSSGPAADPFAGSYRLTASGSSSLPATLSSNPTTGAYTRLTGGTLELSSTTVILNRSYEDRASTTAAATTRQGSDVFTAARAGDRVFAINRTVPSDTQATITINPSGSLLLTWRSSALPTLLYER